MPDILTVYAESQPDKPAVIDDKGDGNIVRWTYAEYEAAANRVGNALLSLGVRPRSKVVWCGPNSPQVVAVMAATRKIGAIAVPLNYRLTAEEARYVVDHCDAEIAYVDAEYAHLFAGLTGDLENLRHVVVYGGPAPDGMLGEEVIAGASAEPPDVGDDVGTGGHDDLHLRAPPASLRARSGTRRPGDRAGSGHAARVPAGRHLHHLGPLYHSGPSAFMAHRSCSARRSWCSASSIPRTGCGWWTSTRSPRRSPRPRSSGWCARCRRR